MKAVEGWRGGGGGVCVCESGEAVRAGTASTWPIVVFHLIAQLDYISNSVHHDRNFRNHPMFCLFVVSEYCFKPPFLKNIALN